MKKIIVLILSTLAIVSCDTPRAKDKQTVSEPGFGERVHEVEVKGHTYLIYDGVYKGNIIHAEHCPCKNTEH